MLETDIKIFLKKKKKLLGSYKLVQKLKIPKKKFVSTYKKS